MQLFYTSLFYLLTPLILFRLYWRGIKSPDYRKRWQERLAIYNKKYSRDVIWFHAVSVGEAEAVFPLIKRLQQNYPLYSFLVTTTTPTGSARVQAVLENTVIHVYLPYDLPPVIDRFLTIFKPKIAIIMEKEIWPNLYAQCAKNNMPLIIINARLSANSAKGYKKIAGLIKPALATVNWIATQTEEDSQRFIDIGAKLQQVKTLGNLKFDLELNKDIFQQAKQLKRQQFSDRFVWIIASTHEGEEILFFKQYPFLKKQIPELLLLVVPRHPERFEQVKALAEQMKLNVCMRSSAESCTINTDVYIADTMGELKLLYGVADVCFVGGSLVPVGGHNMIEPAAMGVPIMFGIHMINFKEITSQLLNLQAAVQCADKEAIIKTILHLYHDKEYRQKIATKAQLFVENNQGTTEKIAQLIIDIIDE